MEDPRALLQEWFEYWRTQDIMPPKMPASLHVRTATFLAMQEYADLQHTATKDALDKLRETHHIPYEDEEHQGGNCVDIIISLMEQPYIIERRVRNFLEWLVLMDDANNSKAVEDRRRVTLDQIINKAKVILDEFNKERK